MSGGYFEYQDYRLEEMAKTLRSKIALVRQKPEWEEYPGNYTEEFLAEMIKAHNDLLALRARLHRLDWVLSGDDGEDTYFSRLPVDLAELKLDNPDEDEKYIAEEKAEHDLWYKPKKDEWFSP